MVPRLVPGYLFKAVAGDPRCIVQLLISGPVVTYLVETIDPHDYHDAGVGFYLFDRGRPRGVSVCCSEALLSISVCQKSD